MLTQNSNKHVSHPPGTTVSIAEFLKHMPVRRQSAVKEKAQAIQLAKIKRTLQAYALARSHIRFSLKVLKAKTDKDNWSYVPKSHGSEMLTADLIADAATKIFGKKLADQCHWISWSFSGTERDNHPSTSGPIALGPIAENEYVFEALLPKADVQDFPTAHMPREFISIDSRPVSCARGTIKQIAGKIKKSYKSAALGRENDKSIHPFFRLNLVCPQGSYDANVEPAKDDVLFHNPDHILFLTEEFLHSVYGKSPSKNVDSTSSPVIPIAQGFDLLLADTPKTIPARPELRHAPTIRMETSVAPMAGTGLQSPPLYPAKNAIHTSRIVPGDQVPNRHEVIGRQSMYDDSEDDEDQLTGTFEVPLMSSAGENPGDHDDINDLSISNPWAIAKLNASIRNTGETRTDFQEDMVVGQLPTPSRQRGDVSISPTLSSGALLPASNRRTQGVPTLERSQDSCHIDGDTTRTSTFMFPQKAWSGRTDGPASNSKSKDDRKRRSHGAIDAWVQTSRDDNTDSSHSERYVYSQIEPERRVCTAGPFTSARTTHAGMALRDIPDVSQKPKRRPGAREQRTGVPNKPFISLVNDPRRVWFPTGENQRRHQAQMVNTSNASNALNSDALNLQDDESEISMASSASARPMHPDLAITMNYEARKQRATQEYRDDQRLQRLEMHRIKRRTGEADTSLPTVTPPSSSPHTNRYLKAKATLQPSHSPSKGAHAICPPIFEAGDPRAFLVSEHARECVGEAHHPPMRHLSKRARTAMLPLETLREEDYIGDLLLKLNRTESIIEQEMIDVIALDEYVAMGKIDDAFTAPTPQQIQTWEAALRRLLGDLLLLRGGSSISASSDDFPRIDLASALAAHAKNGVS